MDKKLKLFEYLLSDILTSALAWSLFNSYRNASLLSLYCAPEHLTELGHQLNTGLVLVAVLWIFLNYVTGYYKDVYRKSRLFELWQTFTNSLTATLILYFIFDLGNTQPICYKETYYPFLGFLMIHFTLTYIPRLVLTTRTTHKVHRREIGFNTILIGSNRKALETWQELLSQKRSSGNYFVGFVKVNTSSKNMFGKYLPDLGNVDDIRNIIDEKKVEEVIIAIESSEKDMINTIINKLIDVNVVIKAIPSMYDILTGRVRMNSILGTPLISVTHNLMPVWQENIKNLLDYSVALVALLITLPLSIFIALGIKLTSKGPVFYSHERIGRYGKPFYIYKFRSMYLNAEKDGPNLSSREDGRITSFGRFLRKLRLDEIPNFFNVLKGDMSLVGPRPERKYYIDQIIQSAPHYLHLLKVKPGITSWGQVKFGYAENVEQMVKRLKYDLIYLDNMSLYVDFKILIYTILTVLKRKGI